MSTLLVENLTKQFPTRSGPLVVLRDISLELSAGDNVAVIGPSGSGKSTLLSILGTLDVPTSGRVRLAGQDPFAGAGIRRSQAPPLGRPSELPHSGFGTSPSVQFTPGEQAHWSGNASPAFGVAAFASQSPRKMRRSFGNSVLLSASAE